MQHKTKHKNGSETDEKREFKMSAFSSGRKLGLAAHGSGQSDNLDVTSENAPFQTFYNIASFKNKTIKCLKHF